MISGNLLTNSLVAEVASNDGYLLQNFQQRNSGAGHQAAAENIARVARVNGIPRGAIFWKNIGAGARQRRIAGRSDLCQQRSGPCSGLNGFIQGLRFFSRKAAERSLKCHYVREMVDKGRV